jgi:hypothetical protein
MLRIISPSNNFRTREAPQILIAHLKSFGVSRRRLKDRGAVCRAGQAGWARMKHTASALAGVNILKSDK